jgi:hypothetical protein
VCHRYPLRRPSELYGLKSDENPDGLDDVQAFELDAALALRYSSIENENWWEKMNYLNNGMRGIMRSLGNDKAKDVIFVKKIADTDDEKKAVAKKNSLFSVVGKNTHIERVSKK